MHNMGTVKYQVKIHLQKYTTDATRNQLSDVITGQQGKNISTSFNLLFKKKKGVNQWFLVSVNNTDFFQFYIDLFVGHCKHIMMGLLIFN